MFFLRNKIFLVSKLKRKKINCEIDEVVVFFRLSVQQNAVQELFRMCYIYLTRKKKNKFSVFHIPQQTLTVVWHKRCETFEEGTAYKRVGWTFLFIHSNFNGSVEHSRIFLRSIEQRHLLYAINVTVSSNRFEIKMTLCVALSSNFVKISRFYVGFINIQYDIKFIMLFYIDYLSIYIL